MSARQFDRFLAEALRDPEVATAYHAAQARNEEITVNTYREDSNGNWVQAEPLGWLEEHGPIARALLFVLGIGHCGKRGWRR